MPPPPATRVRSVARLALAWPGLLTIAVAAAAAAVLWAALLGPGSAVSLDAQNPSVRLQPRWNLVAAPVTTTAHLLFTYLSDLQSAHKWNDATGQFESWRRGTPAAAQTLVQVTAGDGLWLEVTAPIDWELPPLAENPPLPETEGFRLTGWVEDDVPAQDALAQLGGDRRRATR